MAANALNNLMANRNTIRKLMAMDSNGQMDKMLESAKNNGSVSYSQDGVNYTPKMGGNGKVVVNEGVMQNSKMPRSVLESFKQNPGTPLEMPTSVLDSLELESLDVLRNENAVNESVTPQQVANGAIDYSLLRTIINEAVHENVKKYVSAMTKKLMTESTKGVGTVQAVKIGDKFSFITENGDVYEATLKFKTNLNEQTKKK